jgi:hypothetical protein
MSTVKQSADQKNRPYNLLSGQDIDRTAAREARRTRFGNWRIVGKGLVYRSGHDEYWFDVKETAASTLLARLAQLTDKTWLSSAAIGDAVRAMHHMVNLHDVA